MNSLNFLGKIRVIEILFLNMWMITKYNNFNIILKLKYKWKRNLKMKDIYIMAEAKGEKLEKY